MSKYGIGQGLSFTKGGSSQSEENNTSNGKNTMEMAAMSQWSDQEYDDEEEVRGTTGQNNMAQHAWLDVGKSNESNSNVQKYGIGAKLMMKMGYQEGKGLGLNSKGIVQPIETKMLPKGLGVGAVSTKEPEKYHEMDVDSSDDEGTRRQVSSTSLYDCIALLESKDIVVPIKFKELWDERIRHSQAELDEATQKLQTFCREWDEAIKQEKFLSYQAQTAETILESNERQLAAAIEVSRVLESYFFDPIGNSSKVLSSLTKEPCKHLSSIQSIFASVVKEVAPLLFTEHFKTSADEANPLITTLSSWSLLYQDIQEPNSKQLGALDSVLYELFSSNLKIFLNSRTLDEDHNSDVLDIINTWLRSPIFINPELSLQMKLAQEVLVPYFSEKINQWAPGQSIGFLPSYFIDYILLLNPDDAGVFMSLLDLIQEKYVTYLDYSSGNSLWTTSQETITTELKRLKKIWFEVFGQYMGQKTIKNLTSILTDSAINYLANFTSKVEVFLAVVSSELLDTEHVELMLQFQVFNPWITKLFKLCHESPSRVPQWFNDQHQLWVSQAQKYGHIEAALEIATWYFNMALQCLDTGNFSAELPSLNGLILPGVKEIREVLKSSRTFTTSAPKNVNGIPSYKLITTFRDVVSTYCSQNGLIFTSTNLFHATLGHPLFQIQANNKRTWAFISEDVLWVSSMQDSEYTPIALNNLEKWLTK